MWRVHLWQIQGVRDVLLIAAILVLVYIGYWLRDVTVPLLIALALAYLFEPLVQRLCRLRGITRSGAVLIILLTVGVGATLLVTLTAPLAIGQTVRLINRVRSSDFGALAARAAEYAPEQYRDDLNEAAAWIERQFEGESKSKVEKPPETGEAKPDVSETVVVAEPGHDAEPAASKEKPTDDENERIRAVVREELTALGLEAGIAAAPAEDRRQSSAFRLLGMLGPSVHRVIDFLLALVQLSLVAFLIPFYLYFFSVSFPQVLEFGRNLIPVKNRARVLELVGMMDRAVSGFVRGRIVICAVMGLLFAIGWLICGVPYAITLGLFVGAISLVPYLGGIGVPLAVLFLLFDQLQFPAEVRMAWWGILLWPTLVFVIVQSIEGYILTPIIAGKVTNLDPVTIVVAIIAAGSVAGVYGMLLAIPIAACGKILLREVVLPRMRAWSRGEASDPLPIQAIDQHPRSPSDRA